MSPKTINRASSATNPCLLIHLQHRQAGPPPALGEKGLQLSLDGEMALGPEGGPSLCRDHSVAAPRALPELEGRGGGLLFAQGL